MSNIYLHYLDRELNNSVGHKLSSSVIEESTSILLLMTDAKIYSSLSTIYETCSYDKRLLDNMLALVADGHIDVISHHGSIAEFLLSRKALYEHDDKRYPMYFTENINISNIEKKIAILYKDTSTTESLIASFEKISDKKEEFIVPIDRREEKYTDEVISVISHGLNNIGKSALTWAIFSSHSYNDLNIENILRKEISLRYTTHYIDFVNSDIATGIKGLAYYDFLSKRFPLYDIEILKFIYFFSLTSKKGDKISLSDIFIQDVISQRSKSDHLLFVKNIRILIRALFLEHSKTIYDNRFKVRNSIVNAAEQLIYGVNNIFIEPSAEKWILKSNNLINEIIEKYSRSSQLCKHNIDLSKKIEEGFMIKILLCISTDLELRVMSEYSAKNSLTVTTKYQDNLVYFDLGQSYEIKYYAVKTQMGSGSSGGSGFTVEEAIRVLNPDAVIAIGIAFGINKKKQNIGDVLISRQVQAYELQRVGKNEIIPRGDRASANPALVARCDAAKITWKKAKIHTGLILSGDKLVDSPVFKKSLLSIEPEAIGGEMEAAGILAACTKHSIPWLIIKGICDWGENKGDSDQEIACSNAFDLFFHIHNQRGWLFK